MPSSDLAASVSPYTNEDDFVGRLVQNARDTENQDGPTVAQHTFHQPGVEPIFESCQFGNEEEGDERCTDKVQDEGISRSYRRVINCAPPMRGGRTMPEARRNKGCST